jgi:hypothetical protein
VSRLNEIEEARRKAVLAAQAVLDGNLGLIEGARILASLRGRADVEADPDFLLFTAVDSETDHLPIGNERRHWDPNALVKKDLEWEEAENHYRSAIKAACQRIADNLS